MIRKDGSVLPLTSKEQLQGIYIDSLVAESFASARISSVRKVNPNFTFADTLYWDSIRGKWHNLSDLTVYYLVLFSEKQSLDSTVQILKEIEALDLVGREPIPVADSGGLNNE
jgi:hypothetical protein